MTALDHDVIDRLLDSVGDCLTPEVARRIVDLRASPELQARVDELAEKNSLGTLSTQERADYEQYIRFWQFVTLLQAKAGEVIETDPDAA